MSVLKAYAVLDVKVSAFLLPMFFPTTPSALRGFGAAAVDPSHDFSKFPEDYILYEIGSWDSELGMLSALAVPTPLAKALDFKVKDTTG